jgi:hypothetical protein
MENPKKWRYFFQGSFVSVLTCTAISTEVQDKSELAISNGGKGSGGKVASLLESMQEFFNDRGSCNNQFIFGYYNQALSGQ